MPRETRTGQEACPTQALIVGGGMITHDQLLPALYHIQRQGRLGPIAVCASRFATVRDLARAETLLRAFPGQSFRAWPDRDGPPSRTSTTKPSPRCLRARSWSWRCPIRFTMKS